MKNTLENKRYEKKGSRNYMIVGPNTWMNDKDDPDWFIDITTYSRKKNIESNVITTTKNDLQGHMRMYKQDGWKEVPFPEKEEEN